MNSRTAALVFAVFLGLVGPGLGQNLLTNPDFESGGTNVYGWQRRGAGAWVKGGMRGAHGIAVEGDGTQTSSRWTSRAFGSPWTRGGGGLPGLPPGNLYRLSFSVRRDAGSSGGSAVAGAERVNRDFAVTESWNRQSYIFNAPNLRNEDVHLGQWAVKGRLIFDDAELVPVLAAHRRFDGGGELGEGESIEDGVYRFAPYYAWQGANFHRTLLTNTASFNSDRWNFSPGAELTYRFGVDGVPQRSATIQANVNYYRGGQLVIEASQNGSNWVQVGALDGGRSAGKFEVPRALFPSVEIQIRLRATGSDANLQVNQLAYEAPIDGARPDARGETHFMSVLEEHLDVAVQLLNVSLENSQWAVECELSNRSGGELPFTAELSSGIAMPKRYNRRAFPVGGAASWSKLRPKGVTNIVLRAAADGMKSTLRLQVAGSARSLFAGECEVSSYFLDDPRPGYWLQDSDGLAVWWCESGWKVGPSRAAPARRGRAKADPVSVFLARGEYEAAQVLLRPQRDGQLLSAHVEPLRNARGEDAGITASLEEVAYVRVTHPTDGTGERGLHPDPLPPLKGPLALRAGVNQALWITFHASPFTPAGDYSGDLVIETSFGTVRIPLRPSVYDFALPVETHLRSAFGLGTREINRYHGLRADAEKHAVYEKYLQNFANHRISPYSFYDYAPIDVRFAGSGTNKKAQVDFTKFDAAAERWLGPGGFSTFKLQLHGMGGGTFQSRALGSLEGFQEGTAEHARLFGDYLGQIEQHLQQRGWLNKAFTYWFDEPDPKDYEFVVAGMKRLKSAAPGIKRMLTEQPEPVLLGNVDIWCGLTPEWTPEKVRARRAAGESVWWYICTGPKAPYVTEFIDHPGTELRLWPWQSWQYGVEGILVWASLYWNSAAAFPAPQLQDPWRDPMSYVSGYNFKAGHVGFWGNGDGRFLYPPRRDPNTATNAVLDGPINSVRWESLRDGVEDYEYFWLLQHEIERVGKRTEAAALVSQAGALLTVPAEISKDLTHFTTDPRPLLLHRDRVARMIEQLQKIK